MTEQKLPEPFHLGCYFVRQRYTNRYKNPAKCFSLAHPQQEWNPQNALWHRNYLLVIWLRLYTCIIHAV